MPHTADKRTPSDTLLIRNAFPRPQKLVLASVLYAGAACLPKQAISPGTAGSPRSDHCGQGLGGRLRASSLCPPHPQLFVSFGVAPTTLCLRTVCGLVFTRRRKGPRRQGVLGLRRAPRVGWGGGTWKVRGGWLRTAGCRPRHVSMNSVPELAVPRTLTGTGPAEFKVCAGLTGASRSHLAPHSPRPLAPSHCVCWG